jgi:hypothetical protein
MPALTKASGRLSIAIRASSRVAKTAASVRSASERKPRWLAAEIQPIRPASFALITKLMAKRDHDSRAVSPEHPLAIVVFPETNGFRKPMRGTVDIQAPRCFQPRSRRALRAGAADRAACHNHRFSRAARPTDCGHAAGVGGSVESGGELRVMTTAAVMPWARMSTWSVFAISASVAPADPAYDICHWPARQVREASTHPANLQKRK